MKKIIITLFLTIVTVFNLKAQDIQAITNGFPIEIQNVPYQVSIQYADRHYCAGSIINNRYVLTAAHCVKGKSASSITVKVGFSLQNNPGNNVQTFSVRNIVTHPNHNSTTKDFDVAVIEINGTFTFNNFVQPIELISSQTLSAETVCNTARVSGWGWTTPDYNNQSNQLQAVDVPIISNQIADTQLDIAFPNLNPPKIHPELTQRMISTGAVGMNRSGACHGDSGGPLVFKQTGKKDIQIGVVGWGVPRCVGGENSPSIYARLSELVGWIHGKAWSFANIQGSSTVCFNSTQTFTLQNVPNFITATWTSSNNIQVVSSNNTSATVRALNLSSTGNGWVKATLSNGIVLKEKFCVGVPTGYSDGNIVIHRSSMDENLFLDNWTRIWIEGYNGNNWEWSANYSMVRGNNTSAHMLIKPIATGYITVKARIKNDCGNGPWISKDFYVTERPRGGHRFRELD